ncbi:hypothetical protein ACQI4E_29170 [Streptomyces sp. CA-252508]|uniref:hypothetical protein n=1 Tax=Streptomyces sp. CA-252508 TaxID=3418946 RepID=UPI003D9263A2
MTVNDRSAGPKLLMKAAARRPRRAWQEVLRGVAVIIQMIFALMRKPASRNTDNAFHLPFG